MYKRVDVVEEVQGFSYLSKHGIEEQIDMDSVHWARIITGDEKVDIYYEDIPKLMKALQATYDKAKELKYV